jgi:hypothetical protein
MPLASGNCSGKNAMPENSYLLPAHCLSTLKNTRLFYPCSGDDALPAVQLFADTVTDFHFVDWAYFRPGHQDSRHTRLDRPANCQPALLRDQADFELLQVEIDGPVSAPSSGREFAPCVLTEHYQHSPSGNEFRVHRHRDFGENAFDCGIPRLGVFFYRGDSTGEGGSGVDWLATKRIGNICEQLIDGGLIVTDGSQSDYDRAYRPLWQYFGRRNGGHRDWVRSGYSFADDCGHTFNCIGEIDYRYGPTLIWQVNKQKQQHARQVEAAQGETERG